MPYDPFQRELSRLDGFDLVHLGKSTITLGGLVTGGLIIIAAFVLSRLLASAIRRLRTKAGEAAPQVYLVEKLTTYGVIIIGIIAAFSTLGLDLSSLSLFAGALGVGLGFGLQGAFREFISGLILLFDKLVRIGDYIELQSGERGLVEEIGPRATRIRNNDDLNVMIPNSRLIEAPFTNWTHDNQTRRVHVPFHVAYGADKARVRQLVLKAAHEVPFTLPDTDRYKTQVWLIGFGDNGLKFELVVWPALEAVKRPNAAQAAYSWAIDDALRAGGFEMPVPQRDLHVRSLFGDEGEAAKAALGLKSIKTRTVGDEPTAAAVNDAADDLVRGAMEDAKAPPPGTGA
jgi:small-conductance mechanosensitive channel